MGSPRGILGSSLTMILTELTFFSSYAHYFHITLCSLTSAANPSDTTAAKIIKVTD